MVYVGDELIFFNETFKLYLATKMENPHYSPDVFIRVMVVNFTVTVEAL